LRRIEEFNQVKGSPHLRQKKSVDKHQESLKPQNKKHIYENNSIRDQRKRDERLIKSMLEEDSDQEATHSSKYNSRQKAKRNQIYTQ
jgi:hypothetical protein